MLRIFNQSKNTNHYIEAVGRVEAYTDAVLAIIMTILILELHVPDFVTTDMSGVMDGLHHIYPSIFAFIFSFFNIAVIWTNHTHFFHLIKKVNNRVFWYNNFLLLTIAFIPFTTAMLAKYIYTPTVSVIYGLNFFVMSVAFAMLIFYCLKHPELFKVEMSEEQKLTRKKYSLVGPIGFLISSLVACFYPALSYFLFFGVTMIYFLPRKFFE